MFILSFISHQSSKLIRKITHAIKPPDVKLTQRENIKFSKESVRSNVVDIKRLRNSGKLREAQDLALKTIEIFPNNINARCALIEVLLDMRMIECVVPHLIFCRKLDPLEERVRRFSKYINHGVYHYCIEEVEKAISKNSSPKSYLRAAVYLNEGSLYREAEKYARAGMTLLSEDGQQEEIYGELAFQCAFSYEGREQFEKAIELYDSIPDGLKIKRRAASCHARCLLEINNFKKAEEVLECAGVKFQGVVPYNVMLQTLYYLKGDIRQAHLIYRHRATSNLINEYFSMSYKPYEIDIGSGEYIDKVGFIISEGGPGDEIRMASFYSKLKECFNSLTITCDPRLKTLMQRSFPNISFIPVMRYRNEFMAEYNDSRVAVNDRRLSNFINDDAHSVGVSSDIVCSMLDVLPEFRFDIHSFLKGSKLKPDPYLVEFWKGIVAEKNPGHLNVGIAWRSLLQSNTRDRHYLSAKDLMPLSTLSNVNFWILQPCANSDEIEFLSKNLNIHVPEIDLKDDFENQAALMKNLDLIISPFTTTAELAGMLNSDVVIFSRTYITMWRKKDNGMDMWNESARIIHGDPVWDSSTLVNRMVNEINSYL